jgi:frataxin-like iron-binding protein CyaY
MQTNDLASVLKSYSNKRVFWMFSSLNPYACATMFGRAATVDFNASDSTITLAWKQAPGLQGENMNETQFATLQAKGGNVNIIVNNGATMIWPGQMTNGYWFDEVQGVDWLANRIQTDLFNLLYTTSTKVPQTDAGNHIMQTVIEASCIAGINNGLGAPGVWNAAGFGSLENGMTLSKGFYVYAPLIATQSQGDRESRISVPFQVAFKLAGAVHSPDVILNINR